jgi:hypothetical protein
VAQTCVARTAWTACLPRPAARRASLRPTQTTPSRRPPRLDPRPPQLADAAIEEQLEVQTAFREQGSKLQGLYDRKQRTEYDIAKR